MSALLDWHHDFRHEVAIDSARGFGNLLVLTCVEGTMLSETSLPPNEAEGRKANGRHESGVARDYIAVARGSDLVVIHVVGKGNMLTAPVLADFVEQQRKFGFRRFVFDLERCKGLDSTFMGVMVGMYSTLNVGVPAVPPAAAQTKNSEDLVPMSPAEAAAELASALSGKAPASAADALVSAVNVSPELRTLMGMLGVDKFVKVRGNCDLSQLETTILPEKSLGPDDRRRLILRAHENLVEIDKRNEAQFGDFLKMLSMELAQ
mgnify:CR=1 FL=1